MIERVRQLSVAYRLKNDANAGRSLDRLLKNLSGEQTVSVIRAFSYFSHLANIAEDRHHVRRREHHERQGHLHEDRRVVALCDRRPAMALYPPGLPWLRKAQALHAATAIVARPDAEGEFVRT